MSLINRTDNPGEWDWVQEAIKGAIAAMRVCGIATVESYTPEPPRATLRSSLAFRRHDVETDRFVFYEPEVVPNCAVLHPNSGGFFSAMPVPEGQIGAYIVADRSIDEILVGTGVTFSEPQDPRRFDLTDAMFLPMGSFDPIQFIDALNKDWVFGSDDPAGVRFQISPAGQFKFGTPAVEVLQQISDLADKVQQTALNTATSVTTTALGPQPLSNAGQLSALAVQAATIKALINSIKLS